MPSWLKSPPGNVEIVNVPLVTVSGMGSPFAPRSVVLNDPIAVATPVSTSGEVFDVSPLVSMVNVASRPSVALVAKRALSLGRRMMSGSVFRPAPELENTVQLQGSRAWQNLWSAAREAAPKYDVVGLTLQVSIPSMHESFFGEWHANRSASARDTWRMTFPLAIGDRPIGKLTVVGATWGLAALADLEQLCEFIEGLQEEIEHIVAPPAAAGGLEWNVTGDLQPTLN